MPDQQGAGASARIASSEPASAMTLVDLQKTEASEENPLEILASQGIELPKSALLIASPEATFAEPDPDAIEDRSLTEAAGDTAGHAAMFGRYVSQINARIERAWIKPRDAVEHGHFGCQTKIEQDANGKVLSVELRRCNGDVAWQQSLVSAIEHASPLPAPPIPSVFAHQLILNFGANAFEAGVSDERMYAPEIRLADSGASQAVIGDGTKSAGAPELDNFHGSIHLNIEGKNVTWTLEPSSASDANGNGTPRQTGVE